MAAPAPVYVCVREHMRPRSLRCALRFIELRAASLTRPGRWWSGKWTVEWTRMAAFPGNQRFHQDKLTRRFTERARRMGDQSSAFAGSIRPINHLCLLSAARETAIIRIISSALTPVVLMFCKEQNWSGAPTSRVGPSWTRRLNKKETNMLSRPAEVTQRYPPVSWRTHRMIQASISLVWMKCWTRVTFFSLQACNPPPLPASGLAASNRNIAYVISDAWIAAIETMTWWLLFFLRLHSHTFMFVVRPLAQILVHMILWTRFWTGKMAVHWFSQWSQEVLQQKKSHLTRSIFHINRNPKKYKTWLKWLRGWNVMRIKLFYYRRCSYGLLAVFCCCCNCGSFVCSHWIEPELLIITWLFTKKNK